MSFQIFLGFIVTCYLCYYLGTVAYDLLAGRKRAASEDDKVQEEAIDISDEVREFTPILITRPIINKQKTAALKRKQTAELLMTGGIEVNNLRWSRWKTCRKTVRTANWAACLPNGRSLIPKEGTFLHKTYQPFIFNISDLTL